MRPNKILNFISIKEMFELLEICLGHVGFRSSYNWFKTSVDSMLGSAPWNSPNGLW